ncbi:MAG: hypothetical protein H7X71_04445, partial [Chitinophagales bacterium]|nr:hypothetical protein [Chitinophagales bacterium]
MRAKEKYTQFTKSIFFRILLHFGFWVCFLSIPILIFGYVAKFSNPSLLILIGNNVIYIPFYYIFTYFLLPKFFVWRRMHIFIPATVVLYVIFFYTVQIFEVSQLHRITDEEEKEFFNEAVSRPVYYLPVVMQIVFA